MQPVATVLIETEEGQRYDVSAHLLNARTNSSGYAFCSAMQLTITDPGLPYASRISPGCQVLTTFHADSGQTVSSRHRIEHVQRLPAGQSKRISVIEMECRGVEGDLLDVAILSAQEAFDQLRGIADLLPKILAHSELLRYRDFAASVGTDIEATYRVAIVGATPFEVLKVVADHFGYTFHMDRSDTIVWRNRPPSPQDAPVTHLFLTADMIGDVTSQQLAPDPAERVLGEWV